MFTSHEPLVITAMSCRFPGCKDPFELWQTIAAGEDRIGPWPDERELPAGIASSDIVGGFLPNVDVFDAGYFGISPREAQAMDPQQRLALELATQAFESAGLSRSDLRRTNTGVFVGAMNQEYGPRLAQRDDDSIGYGITGSSVSVISGRISYVYDLKGPALTVETACSSSLVALHLAVQSLRAGECDRALVGGLCIMPTAGLFVDFSRQGGLDLRGHCRTFSAEASGTVWSEGGGMVLVETLSSARAGGRQVLATVLGTAINHDGATNGLTAPSRQSQEAVIQSALADAGLDPDDVDLLEAHGTATPLGDAIELAALQRAYGRGRTPNHPLYIGSLKSNLGHTQAAAGIGGLIKVIQALRHRVLPATLHALPLNLDFEWEDGNLSVLTEARKWQPRGVGKHRVAAVSAFGISGTNAHVLIGEGEPSPAITTSAVPVAVRVDGVDHRARRDRAAELGAYVAETGDLGSLADVLASRPRRTPCVHLITTNPSEAVTALGQGPDEAIASDVPLTSTPRWIAPLQGAGRPVFVFGGQGSQWSGMGSELMQESEPFRKHLDACRNILASLVDWDLFEELRKMPQDADIVQPCLFATMTGLAAAWRAAGVEPAGVIGHSQGEMAAAYVAGALSLREAIRLVVGRSRVISENPIPGGMLSLRAGQETAADLIDRSGLEVTIAAYNGPNATVVAGENAVLEHLVTLAEREGFGARLVAVDYASHSPATTKLREPLSEALADIPRRRPSVPFFSTLRGAQLAADNVLDTDYWITNLCEPVRFEAAVRGCIESGLTTFVECSPTPLLVRDIKEIAQTSATPVFAVHSIRKDAAGVGELLRNVCLIDESRTRREPTRGLPDAPATPFAGASYWLSVPPDVPAAEPTHGGHGLIVNTGRRLDGSGTARLAKDPAQFAWLAGHQVRGQAIVPATAVLEALFDLAPEGCLMEEVVFRSPLTADREPAVVDSVRHANEVMEFAVKTDPQGTDTGPIRPPVVARAVRDDGVGWVPPMPSQRPEPVDVEALYRELESRGYGYSPAFRLVSHIEREGSVFRSEVQAPRADESWAPALDACVHATLLGFEGLMLPFMWKNVRLDRTTLATDRLLVTSEVFGDSVVRLQCRTPEGRVVFSVDEIEFRPAAQIRPALERVEWHRILRAQDVEPGPAPVTHPLAGAPGEVLAALLEKDGVAYVDVIEPELPDAATLSDHLDAAAACIRQCRGRQGARLVFLTHALIVDPNDQGPGLLGAGVAALVRAAERETAGVAAVIDTDGTAPQLATRPELFDPFREAFAVRHGEFFERRIALDTGNALQLPATPDDPWRIDVSRRGTLLDLAVLPSDADRELTDHEVRIEVQVAGLNFRDIAVALNLVATEQTMGSEGAGVVVAVGDSVTAFQPGDRVFGVFSESLANWAVADEYAIRKIPAGWSTVQAAAMPIAGVTAYQCLVDVAHIQAGEKVLVHTATGSVGVAALHIARSLGCEVFATASPGKRALLLAMGVPQDHIASSRDTAFAESFRAVTGGTGVDVILNSLVGQSIDASLSLLASGGRFVEMGKREIRPSAEILQQHPNVSYQAYNILATPSVRIGEVLNALIELYQAGSVSWPYLRNYDVRDVSQALGRIRRAKHLGKLTASIPPRLERATTCLLFGGIEGVGATVARHLCQEFQMGHLVVASRSPVEDQSGRQLESVACDVTDEAAVRSIIEDLQPDLIIHAAAVLRDRSVENLTRDDFFDVVNPKLTGLRNICRSAETLAKPVRILAFSSVAGVVGTAGQGNYAAANAMMDRLAEHLFMVRGCQVQSIAWGLWRRPTKLTGDLSETDVDRLATLSGLKPMSDMDSLALVDQAVRSTSAAVVAAGWADIGQSQTPTVSAGEEPQPSDELQQLMDAICRESERVLGVPEGSLEADSSFRAQGFDSLLSVDLRNKLARSLSVPIRADMVLEADSPRVLADRIQSGGGATTSMTHKVKEEK